MCPCSQSDSKYLSLQQLQVLVPVLALDKVGQKGIQQKV